jgi:hypothetical protein
LSCRGCPRQWWCKPWTSGVASNTSPSTAEKYNSNTSPSTAVKYKSNMQYHWFANNTFHEIFTAVKMLAVTSYSDYDGYRLGTHITGGQLLLPINHHPSKILLCKKRLLTHSVWCRTFPLTFRLTAIRHFLLPSG